jgi:hypothetical protein
VPDYGREGSRPASIEPPQDTAAGDVDAIGLAGYCGILTEEFLRRSPAVRLWYCRGSQGQPASSAIGGDDFADEGLERGWGGGESEGGAEHPVGLGEQGGVFAEEGDEGLVGFDFVA